MVVITALIKVINEVSQMVNLSAQGFVPSAYTRVTGETRLV